MTATTEPAEIAKATYRAFADGDRAAIERLIAPDFRFTSPLDNGIDRETYFARCWPNHTAIAGFEFVRVVPAGEAVIVTYEGRSNRGPGFRNTEVLRIRDGQVHEVEVYFGWSLPHRAPAGGFTEEAA